MKDIDEQLHKDRGKSEYRDKGYRPTKINTVYGEVEYSRHVYLTMTEDGRNSAVFLLDKELGMDTIAMETMDNRSGFGAMHSRMESPGGLPTRLHTAPR